MKNEITFWKKAKPCKDRPCPVCKKNSLYITDFELYRDLDKICNFPSQRINFNALDKLKMKLRFICECGFEGKFDDYKSKTKGLKFIYKDLK